MTTQTGKIVKWINERNFGFIQPEGTSGKNEQLFMHISNSQLPNASLKEGTVVEYEAVPGKRGMEAQNVRLSGQGDNLPPKGYRFLNPYNFVRYLPAHAESDDPNVKLLERFSPPTHDRWLGLSGRIECRLETVTPLFISDSEEVEIEKSWGKKKKHYSYRFFQLGKNKAIPATALKGVIRSTFEAVTNSCFSNLSDARLSYRLDGRELQKLVPALVVKQETVEPDEKGEERKVTKWYIKLLPGKLLPDQPLFDPELGQKKGLYAAPVRFYDAIKPSGRGRQSPPPPVDNADNWQHGQKCYAVLRQMKFPPCWRAIALANTQTEAEKLTIEIKRRLPSDATLIVRQGWLCKTLQNTDNKNSERFFFREPGRTDIPEMLLLPPEACRDYEALIKDYRQRHASDLDKRNNPAQAEEVAPGKWEAAYSRFVQKENKHEETLKGDELVYVWLDRQRSGQLTVRFIVPVSWPRVAYEHTIGQLLPNHLHRCQDYDALCPACRTFGWVHAEGHGRDQIAYAGRLRFEHALLKTPGAALPPQTLSILGSPKPTTTRFYLADPSGKPSSRPRADHEVGYDGNNGRNRLRGRKFYRHFLPDDRFRLDQEQSDQNRTIRDAEGPGAVFTFSIEFENLAPVELGALLWSLTLNGKGYHRLGYGKPLGMGSVQISVKKLFFYDFLARYQSLESTSWQQLVPAKAQTNMIVRFQEAMVRPYATPEVIAYAEKQETAVWQILFEDLPNVQDLLTLLSMEAPTLPVHYPYSPDPKSNGQFEWFVGNNRLNGPRIELSLTTEDKGLPLIYRDGKPH